MPSSWSTQLQSVPIALALLFKYGWNIIVLNPWAAFSAEANSLLYLLMLELEDSGLHESIPIISGTHTGNAELKR